MSDQSLADELRSVLLAHSFDAPAPDDTIARTMAETLEVNRIAERLDRPWWRSGTGGLVAAAVVGVCALGGAGLVAVNHDGNSSTSSTAKSDQAAGAASNALGTNTLPPGSMGPALGVAPTLGSTSPKSAPLVPNNLSCAAAPGGKTIVNFDVPVTLSGVKDQVISAQCSDGTGRRNSAQVYTVRTTDGRSTLQATVLRQSDGVSVQSITGGHDQFTVRYLRLATATTGEALEQKTFGTHDNGASYPDVDTKLIAPACTAAGLTATVVAGAGRNGAVLRVRNSGAAVCELSGYPSIAAGMPTLGPSKDGLVPIVVLQPGQTGSAVIADANPSVPCPHSSGTPQITLPTGERLPAVTAQTAVSCRALVYPFTSGTG